ncbi:MAG: XrtA/PEP-CTERM system histidine kinase PrsK [Marinagarivorans sp.]|nr:XrtA/PEP-CTERM system histidine kinase PrsK [Marinagarivorans sp.]
MTYTSATFIAYLGASVFSIVLIFAFASQLRTAALRPIFGLAAGMQSAWLVWSSYVLAQPSHRDLALVSSLDMAQQVFWVWALIQSMQHHCTNKLPKIITPGFLPISLLVVGMQLWLALIMDITNYALFAAPSLALSMFGLLCVNRLYCSSSNIRLLKLICIAVGVMITFTAYYSLSSLLSLQTASSISGTRVTVVLAASIVLLLGTLTLPKETIEPHAKMALSRPAILYIVLFSLSAAILTIFALTSLYIRRFGGGFGEAIYLLLVSSAVIAVVFLLTSNSFRNLLNVLINKHLFSHKYDYRTEWLKLIGNLSKPANNQEAYGIALNVTMDIFKSPGGALYIAKGDSFSLALAQNCNVNPSITEAINAPFTRILKESEWVFFPNLPPTHSPLDRFNETLPDWIRYINNVWLVMPMIYETKLTGFIILNEPNSKTSLNWEDLDLLKITGRQIASYIEGHRKSEALSEAKQFETFNKLSAFVMHDLKNLIAQQSLLVDNAVKHKGNPAFIDDAFGTIKSSVDRLNILLQKLQRSEPEASRSIDVKPVIIDAVSRCSRVLPIPSLRLETDNLRLLAAPDTLSMVLVHLIQNAQEATRSSGFVDILVTAKDKTLQISIEDNGKGMDESFIKHQLFKPFETTKTGKGMGIGVYQAKDYIEHLGGSIKVESTPNHGSIFIVQLPLLQKNSLACENR